MYKSRSIVAAVILALGCGIVFLPSTLLTPVHYLAAYCIAIICMLAQAGHVRASCSGVTLNETAEPNGIRILADSLLFISCSLVAYLIVVCYAIPK